MRNQKESLPSRVESWPRPRGSSLRSEGGTISWTHFKWSLKWFDKFLNLPVRANFYGLTDLSGSSTSTNFKQTSYIGLTSSVGPWPSESRSLNLVSQLGPSTWSLNLVPQLGPSTRSLILVPQLGHSTWSLNLVHQLGPSTGSLNLVPQLGPSTGALNLEVPQLGPQLGPST